MRDVDISGSVQRERKAGGRRTVGRHTGGDGCGGGEHLGSLSGAIYEPRENHNGTREPYLFQLNLGDHPLSQEKGGTTLYPEKNWTFVFKALSPCVAVSNDTK